MLPRGAHGRQHAHGLQTWLNVVQAAADIAELQPDQRFALFVERDLPLSIAPLNRVAARSDAWDRLRNKAQGDAQLTMLGETQRRQALGLPMPAGMPTS